MPAHEARGEAEGRGAGWGGGEYDAQTDRSQVVGRAGRVNWWGGQITPLTRHREGNAICLRGTVCSAHAHTSQVKGGLCLQASCDEAKDFAEKTHNNFGRRDGVRRTRVGQISGSDEINTRYQESRCETVDLGDPMHGIGSFD